MSALISKVPVSVVIGHIKQSCTDGEFGDIRSILDEYACHPLWGEQVIINAYLTKHVHGALFDFNKETGWGYVEEFE